MCRFRSCQIRYARRLDREIIVIDPISRIISPE